MNYHLFARGLKKLKLLNLVNFTDHIEINNRKYSIPIIRGLGWDNLYSQDLWMIDVLYKLYTQESVQDGAFIDVGANVGQTLLKVKSINNTTKYYGFEPNFSCVYYLQKLVDANTLAGVSIFPIAITDETKIVRLILNYGGDTDASATIIENFRERNINTKDAFIAAFDFRSLTKSVEINKVSIIKIDVEGAEGSVLRGMKDIIRRDQPYILIEILPVYSQEREDRYQQQTKIESLVQKLDYRMFRILKENNRLLKFEQITTIGVHDSMDFCDYLLVPKDYKFQLNV